MCISSARVRRRTPRVHKLHNARHSHSKPRSLLPPPSPTPCPARRGGGTLHVHAAALQPPCAATARPVAPQRWLSGGNARWELRGGNCAERGGLRPIPCGGWWGTRRVVESAARGGVRGGRAVCAGLLGEEGEGAALGDARIDAKD
eukprot:2843976-Prymnesium_polylepis.1